MLQGKTALVTGATKRIGRAIASAIAENKTNVIIHYHRSTAECADNLINHIRKFGVKTWKFQADFSKIEETDELFKQIKDQVGIVDILINNASTFTPSKTKTLTIKELQETLTINSIAPFRLSQHFARQTNEGCIVNILDSRIKQYDLNHAAYQLSKNMLHHITEIMALEYAPHIRVNGVAPGLIIPPPAKKESYIHEQSTGNLLLRYGKMTDISHAVIYLLTNHFITGEILYVDGGQRLKGMLYQK